MGKINPVEFGLEELNNGLQRSTIYVQRITSIITCLNSRIEVDKPGMHVLTENDENQTHVYATE